MNKKTYNLFFSIILVGISLTIMLSCSTSHSVREIRAMREGDPTYMYNVSRSVKVSKTSKEALTKPLFMQSKRANIELPYQAAKTDPSIALVSERVDYKNAEKLTRNSARKNRKDVNLNEVQELSEVVVTARSRFTPERNGRVDVDFVVKVPKELISPKWRITLSPTLIHNDSVIKLKEIIIKGKEFLGKQKADYKAYDDYLKSIVKKEDYDSVFFDHNAAMKDINERQAFNYKEYYKEWNRQVEYEKWKSEKERLDALQYAKMTGYREKIYNEHARKAREIAVLEHAKGKDTTGVFNNYMKQYEKKLNASIPQETPEQKIKNTPAKYRDIAVSGRTLADIENKLISFNDSIEIVKHRYLFEEIAENEMKEARKDEVFKELVVFPYEQGMYLDTILDGSKNFTLLYKKDYPVTPGLKSLKLAMSSKVEALDRSEYKMRNSDTLSYFVSSLSQLIDASLVQKKTKIYRDVYNTMTIYPSFTNKSSFSIDHQNNRSEIAKVTNTYKTFTKEGNLVMDSIMIRVSTSLDGTYDSNAELSMKRANALKEYFVKSMPEIDGKAIFKVRYVGEDWNTLATLIGKRTDLSHKERILKMLSEAVNPDQSEMNIKKLYPADFKIITDSIYPLLNKADFIFNMHRPNMTNATELKVETRDGYEEGLRLLQDREYWKAIEILAEYPDYNTALCLVCMGYNVKAKELLDRLPIDGNSEYLRAILAIRAGEESQAIDHLLNACEMDPTKVYRAPLDPEVWELVTKHRLQQKMDKKAKSGQIFIED